MAQGEEIAIDVIQENPKRPGTKSHQRYEKYKKAKTKSEYLELGGSKADYKYDKSRGFIVEKGDEKTEAKPAKRGRKKAADDEPAAKKATKKSKKQDEEAKKEGEGAAEGDKAPDDDGMSADKEEKQEEGADKAAEEPKKKGPAKK